MMRRSKLVRSFLGLCLGLSLASPARAALNRWSSGGPPAGAPIEVLAFDPFVPGTVYAGTYGGVFRSEDNGATWTAANFGLASDIVTGLEADPITPGTLYAATSRGVQRSQDRGLTWQTSAIQGVNAFALDPSNPQTLYAATGDEIFKSTNGGASWAYLLTLDGQDSIFTLEVDPLMPAIVYAGTNASLYRSLNGGATFAPLTGLAAEPRHLAIDPTDSRILYAGTFQGVYKSTDRGLTWALSGQALAEEVILAVAIDPASPSVLLAVGFAVFLSTDGGETWATLFDEVLAFHSVAFAPSSAPAWLVGSSDGIYRSTDLGASWIPSNTGLTASIVEDLVVDPHRPGTLYAALPGPGALYKSADAGASWSPIGGIPGVRAIAADPKAPSRLYAATDGGIFRSQDGGATWVRINSGETAANELVIDPQTPSTLYLASYSAGIRKSTDGGISWSEAGPAVEEFAPYVLEVSPSEPQTVFAGDFQHGLYKSSNGGETWTAVSGGGLPQFVANTVAIHPHDANVLYAGVATERIYKSTDGGSTWFPSGTGLPFASVEGIAIDPFQPSRLYATNTKRGIFRSTDAGATWSQFNDGRLPELWISQIVLDPVNPHLLYAASVGGGVLSRAELQPGDSLQLNGNRFRVKMGWATGQGLAGPGITKNLTGDTGYATFFSESNVEVLLKVLDGCGINGHFWVFAAGLTNVRTDITVADTQTGAVKIYHNPANQVFQPIQDTSALACGPGTAFVAAKELSATAEPVLLRGRFRVTAEFVTAPGATPLPTQGALLTDDTGYLWFYDQNNVEVFLKVVDGCALNDRFWIFAAGLTDVEMRITVEDTKTGASKVYENPRGTAFRPVQDTNAFGGCD
jgi:photosystem II stability/assembly factor-like uncharacterized protein